MDKRNSLVGAPDNPKIGDTWSDGKYGFVWTSEGWKCIYEPQHPDTF